MGVNSEPDPDDIWKVPASRLLEQLGTTQSGLTSAEAKKRLFAHGPNDAATVKRAPL